MRFFSTTVALLAIISGVGEAQTLPAPPRIPEITANGRGEVRIPPDRGTVYLAVETRATTAEAAVSDNAAKTSATIQALRGAGIKEDQISTAGYSLQQEYRYLPPNTPRRDSAGALVREREFAVRNTVRADVLQPGAMGALIDAAVRGGATQISSVQRYAANTDDARRQAFIAAVAQARRDAETIAEAAGGRLGNLIQMSSGVGSAATVSYQADYAVSRTMGGVASAPTAINPADVAVSATVFGRWEFIPGARR